MEKKTLHEVALELDKSSCSHTPQFHQTSGNIASLIMDNILPTWLYKFQEPTRPLCRAYEIIDKKRDAQTTPARITT